MVNINPISTLEGKKSLYGMIEQDENLFVGGQKVFVAMIGWLEHEQGRLGI